MFGSLTLFGQTKGVNRDKYRIHITKTYTTMSIDGILDEKPWMTAEHTGNFTRVLPVDSGYASVQTDVMVTYDESNLYVGFICYDPTQERELSNLCAEISLLTGTITVWFFLTPIMIKLMDLFSESHLLVRKLTDCCMRQHELHTLGVPSGNRRLKVMMTAGWLSF